MSRFIVDISDDESDEIPSSFIKTAISEKLEETEYDGCFQCELKCTNCHLIKVEKINKNNEVNMAIVEKIKFDFPVLQHETIWDSKDGVYLDIVYIAVDESVSFTVYSYDPEDIVLRNLYVTEKCRIKGIATSVIMSIQKYCDATGRTLSLWAKGWLIDWYISLGFKTGDQFDEDGSVWLTYESKKNKENEIEQITC